MAGLHRGLPWSHCQRRNGPLFAQVWLSLRPELRGGFGESCGQQPMRGFDQGGCHWHGLFCMRPLCRRGLRLSPEKCRGSQIRSSRQQVAWAQNGATPTVGPAGIRRRMCFAQRKASRRTHLNITPGQMGTMTQAKF